MELINIAGTAALLLGGFFLLSSGVGVWRFPDVFTRLHATSVADAAGAPLVFLGIALLLPAGLVTLKIVLLVVFSLVSSATASHALAKAALLHQKPLGRTLKKSTKKAKK